MAAPPPPSYNATCTNLPLGCMVQTEDDKHLLDFPLAAMSAIKLLDLSMCHRGLNSYVYVAKCGDCGIMSEYDRDSEYVYAKAAGKDWVFSAADRDRVLKDLHSLKFFASDHFLRHSTAKTTATYLAPLRYLAVSSSSMRMSRGKGRPAASTTKGFILRRPGIRAQLCLSLNLSSPTLSTGPTLACTSMHSTSRRFKSELSNMGLLAVEAKSTLQPPAKGEVHRPKELATPSHSL